MALLLAGRSEITGTTSQSGVAVGVCSICVDLGRKDLNKGREKKLTQEERETGRQVFARLADSEGVRT